MAMQPMKMDHTHMRCAACGNDAPIDVPLRQHRAHHNSITYTLQRCTVCDLQFWSPLKADPSVYATEGYEAYVDYHSGARPFPRWAEPLFAILPPERGNALDIGCGDGAVLHRLAQAGYIPHGIDLDEKSVAVAREKFSLTKVVVSTLDAYENISSARGERFDLLTFFEVLEHQDAPLDFLKQVRRLCQPGAVVAGSVPNRDRFLAKLDRLVGEGDLPPHHFLWFSRASLARLLEHAGFVDTRIVRVGALSYVDVVAKLGKLIDRKLHSLPGRIRWLAVPIKILLPALAIGPWIGLRIAPSHLFFYCRVPIEEAS